MEDSFSITPLELFKVTIVVSTESPEPDPNGTGLLRRLLDLENQKAEAKSLDVQTGRKRDLIYDDTLAPPGSLMHLLCACLNPTGAHELNGQVVARDNSVCECIVQDTEEESPCSMPVPKKKIQFPCFGLSYRIALKSSSTSLYP
jgi:hypothetical protein